jgi:hypothetical protein
MLSVTLYCYVECRYAECHHAEHQYTKCHYAECPYVGYHFAKYQGTFRARTHNTSFSFHLTKGINKLNCYSTLDLKGFLGSNNIAY